MHITALSELTLDKLVLFEKRARLSEPDIFAQGFDEVAFRNGTLAALKNPIFSSARCLICINDNGDIVGRIDFSILPSFAFAGDLRAYVDWVYVLKAFRHKGIAQALFEKMEEVLTALGVHEYFLVAAENEEAQRFYNAFPKAQIQKRDILTKTGMSG